MGIARGGGAARASATADSRGRARFRARDRARPQASRGDTCPPKPQNLENDETPVETRAAGRDAERGMTATRRDPVGAIPSRVLSPLSRSRRARVRADASASGTPKRRNRKGDALERRPRDAPLMPFMAGNAVAAPPRRGCQALRRTPTVGIAVDMAAMENIVLVLVLRESPSSVARWCERGAFRDRRVYPRA